MVELATSSGGEANSRWLACNTCIPRPPTGHIDRNLFDAQTDDNCTSHSSQINAPPFVLASRIPETIMELSRREQSRPPEHTVLCLFMTVGIFNTIYHHHYRRRFVDTGPNQGSLIS